MLGTSEIRTFLLFEPRGYDNATHTQKQPLLIKLAAEVKELHFNCWLLTAL